MTPEYEMYEVENEPLATTVWGATVIGVTVGGVRSCICTMSFSRSIRKLFQESQIVAYLVYARPLGVEDIHTTCKMG